MSGSSERVGEQTVGVVGLGAMGRRVARRLLDSGLRLVVWNRTPGRADELVAAGAVAAASPALAAREADVLMTMVSDPSALVDVSTGGEGIVAGVRPGAAVVEMSTVGPEAVRRLRAALPPATAVVDAPVLGSLGEAENGTLTIFVGGEAADVARVEPILAVLGEPMHVGPLGSGAAAKLVANSTLVATLVALGEALALAAALGLPRDTAFRVLASTPLAQQAERRRAAFEHGEYPRRFRLALARKDAFLVREAAAGAGAELRLAAAAESWLADAEAAGLGEEDYSAVLAHIHERGERGQVG